MFPVSPLAWKMENHSGRWALSVWVVSGQGWADRISNDLEVGRREIGGKNQVGQKRTIKELRIYFCLNVTSDPFVDYLAALNKLMFKSVSEQGTSGDSLWAKCSTYVLGFSRRT